MDDDEVVLFVSCSIKSHHVPVTIVSPRQLGCKCGAFAIAVMAMTRGMTAKQNQNARNRKRSMNINNDGGSASWSCMIPDILFSVIMRLRVIDFVSFSGVCKSWRTAALSHRNMLMLPRQPMAMHVSTHVARRTECCLEDSKGTRFTTILPRTRGRTYVGLVSGYLVFFGRKTRDFRLVNPITKHQLHFRRCPFHAVTHPEAFRGTLVFSRATSRWVFLISAKFSRSVSFLSSGKHARWTHLSFDVPIYDIQFFQGKIYTVNTDVRVCEVRLNPKPTLTPLEMKNSAGSDIILPEFASLGKKLFVMSYGPENRCGSVEVDFDQMRWVSSIALKEYACYVSIMECGLSKMEFWKEPQTQFARFDFDQNQRFRATTNMWYFPHKCLEVNHLHG